MSEEGKRAAAEIAARLAELQAQRDELAKSLDNALMWIADSDANKNWNSITTPDFVVEGLLALSRAQRNP